MDWKQLGKRQTALVLACGLSGLAAAQQPVEQSPLQVNYCEAQASVASHTQDGRDVTLAMEVAVQNCGNTCMGMVEYDLVFLDDNDDEIKWHKNEPWDWRKVEDSFTMDISFQAAPGYELQAVENISVDRCSNSKLNGFE